MLFQLHWEAIESFKQGSNTIYIFQKLKWLLCILYCLGIRKEKINFILNNFTKLFFNKKRKPDFKI